MSGEASGQIAGLVERAFAPFDVRWYEACARAAGAGPAVAAGLPDADERFAAALPYTEQNDWAAACLARTRKVGRRPRRAGRPAGRRMR